MIERDGARVAAVLQAGLGRRGFLRVISAMSALGGAATMSAGTAHAATTATTAATTAGSGGVTGWGGTPLQPFRGPIAGRHYLPSEVDKVLWGYVPTVHATPVLTIRSRETVTIDALSHEGILEDQGRDPVSYFASHGVARRNVLADGIEIASGYDRTTRNFDVDGPHVVTGPVAVRGAEPGDVLKIETLALLPRVPYGVVSSRHGKGALARQLVTSGLTDVGLDAAMPPVATDGRGAGVDPTDYGNVSIFTAVKGTKGVMTAGRKTIRFPLRPFMGMMGVAFAETTTLTAPEANSIPPTLGGGNIDIRHLGVGSTFYLPVKAPGGLFYVGDPHMAMGDGEVALTAMEGSLRGTFRLTVCKPGSGDAPSVSFRYPFAETRDAWIPIGLSDPNGSTEGQVNDLDIANRRAVLNALDFLEHDQGIDRAVAYAYLSAAADFSVSQVVDRTVGVHALISKEHFA